MRIIYDAPGQTCNRLWSYVASVAMCIAKHKKMIIIFHDETVEDFPSFLNCPFIYFPLWSIGKGKKWYTGLIWRIKFNYKNSWKIICDFWGFTNGWDTRFDAKYIIQTLPNLQKIFRPKEEIMQKAQATIDTLKRESDIVIGIHIRRGDYASWQNGRFYFGLDVYYKYMMQIKKIFSNQRVSFFISSNEDFSTNIFEDCKCLRYGHEPSGAILDLYTLSLCDRLIGPVSTFSRWASFIGEVPLCFIESKDQVITENSFSRIVDFFHFENGNEIQDW